MKDTKDHCAMNEMENAKKSVLTKRIYGNELRYLKEVLQTEFRSSSGSKMTRRLEEAFAQRFGTRYAIAFVNGTATLHAALEAFGIQAGDEVIVPPLTMSATTFAVLQANATPVFADIDPETYQISPASIEGKITDRTRAIITVALYGLSPDMDAILTVARKHDLYVLEDSAQSFLTSYNGRLGGTFGDCASFSFQSSKHLTSGEGGIVITDDPGLADQIRKVQSLGYADVSASKGKISKKDIQDPDYFRHVSMGWNYRIPELCAAVALAQLENIDALVKRRMDVSGLFEEAARGFDWFVPQYVGSEYIHSYWSWVARLDRLDVTWHQFRDQFVANGGDGIYASWKLTYLEPMFQTMNLLGREKFISNSNRNTYKRGLCPVAENIAPRLLQFKTNYWDLEKAERQAEILRVTLKKF